MRLSLTTNRHIHADSYQLNSSINLHHFYSEFSHSYLLELCVSNRKPFTTPNREEKKERHSHTQFRHMKVHQLIERERKKIIQQYKKVNHGSYTLNISLKFSFLHLFAIDSRKHTFSVYTIYLSDFPNDGRKTVRNDTTHTVFDTK